MKRIFEEGLELRYGILYSQAGLEFYKLDILKENDWYINALAYSYRNADDLEDSYIKIAIEEWEDFIT